MPGGSNIRKSWEWGSPPDRMLGWIRAFLQTRSGTAPASRISVGWRNSILVKKRGDRRTGLALVGHWSEVLLSLLLVVVGGTMLTLHVKNVLIPEMRYAREIRGFEPAQCRIVRTRIEYRTSPIGAPKYVLDVFASRLEDGKELPPVWMERGAADFSPSRSDTEVLSRRYAVGSIQSCYYDPEDPQRLVMGRRLSWWPWPVALIPASLLAVGLWGVAASLMQVSTSAERRSMVAVKAFRFDPSRESEGGLSATLPAYESEVEIPGIRFAHRLPLADSGAWRMAGLFFASAVWNTLLAYFLYEISLRQVTDDSGWLALGLVVVLGMVGVWLAFQLVHELWERRGIGMTVIELAECPLHVGGATDGYLLQQGQMKLQSLALRLVMEEAASYQQGTNAQTATQRVYEKEIRRWRGLDVAYGLPFEADFSLEMPTTAMHSFRAPHNEIRWLLEVSGTTQRKQEILRRFPLAVLPAGVGESSDPKNSAAENAAKEVEV